MNNDKEFDILDDKEKLAVITEIDEDGVCTAKSITTGRIIKLQVDFEIGDYIVMPDL